LLSSLPSDLPFFPYTTLFRSVIVLRHSRLIENIFEGHFGKRSVRVGVEIVRVLVVVVFILVHVSPFRHFKGTNSHLLRVILFLLDRKSTRLNSSHVSISYAVF